MKQPQKLILSISHIITLLMLARCQNSGVVCVQYVFSQ